MFEDNIKHTTANIAINNDLFETKQTGLRENNAMRYIFTKTM